MTSNKRKNPGIEQDITALTTLFNSVLYYERTPKQWGNITFSFLSTREREIENGSRNRPVSLMPCISKLFEKLISDAFALYRPDFPCAQQQGFRKQLSCMTATFNLQETIYQQIEGNSNVYVGTLDQKAAFDVVWHHGLFAKLGRLEIVGKIIRTLILS